MSTNFEDLIGRSNTAGKPTAGIAGRLWYDTTLNKLQRDSGSSWEDVEGSGSGASIDIALVKRNSNASSGDDYSISNGSWVEVDSINLRLTIAAVEGDILGLGVNGVWYGNAYAALTVATIVSGSIVNYIDTGSGTPGTNGVFGWEDVNNSAQPGSGQTISGEFLYEVQSGDISGGNVIVSLVAKAFAAGKTIICRTGSPLQFYVKNYK